MLRDLAIEKSQTMIENIFLPPYFCGEFERVSIRNGREGREIYLSSSAMDL